MSGALRLAVIAVAAALSLAVLWMTDVPLGIPGEWVWRRIDYSGAAAEAVLGIAQFGIVGAIYLLLVWLGLRRVSDCGRPELAAWLGALTLTGFAWLVAVQEGPRGEYRLSKAPFVLHYPASSGYFHTARYDTTSVAQLLQTYEQRMEQGDVLHEGTHPPGLYVGYRALMALVEVCPATIHVSDATMPDSFRDALDTIDYSRQTPVDSTANDALRPEDRAVLWLMTLLTIASAAATAVPLFVLVRQTESRTTAWRAAAFWALIPALAIFVPKSDVLFVFPAALLVMVWMLAVHRQSAGQTERCKTGDTRKQSAVLGALAGLIGWCGLFQSLVFLPIGLAAFLAGLLTAVPAERTSLRAGFMQALLRIAAPAMAGAVAVIVMTAAVSFLTEMNLVRVWWLNWQNHAGFYEQYSRSVLSWLLINPTELTFAAGAPITCLGVIAVAHARRNRLCRMRPAAVAVVLVWGLLWLSGKNSGEAARLWIPLLPLLVWVAAASLRETTLSADDPSSNERRDIGFLIALAIQMIVCGGTVLRVGGFHFAGNTG